MTNRKRAKQLLIRRTIIISGIVLAAVLMLYLIAYFILNATVSQVKKDTIGSNIYIANVEVSGKTAKEAKASIKEQVELYERESITLVAEDAKIKVTLKDLGFEIKDLDKAIKKAVSYGKEGSMWNRYQKIKSLENGVTRFEVTYAVDADKTEQTISDKMPELENAAKNATIKRVDNGFVITEGKKGKKKN